MQLNSVKFKYISNTNLNFAQSINIRGKKYPRKKFNTKVIKRNNYFKNLRKFLDFVPLQSIFSIIFVRAKYIQYCERINLNYIP